MGRFEYRKGVYQGKIIILFIKLNGRDSGGVLNWINQPRGLACFPLFESLRIAFRHRKSIVCSIGWRLC